MNVQEKGSRQDQVSCSNVISLKKNHFYVLRSRGEQVSFVCMVTSILQVYCSDVYALLDLVATLSFVTPLIDRKFDILPNILSEPFRLQRGYIEIVL